MAQLRHMRRFVHFLALVQIINSLWLVSGAVESTNEQDPVIYFYIPRWETRTFSPRLRYLYMKMRNETETTPPIINSEPVSIKENQQELFSNRKFSASLNRPVRVLHTGDEKMIFKDEMDHGLQREVVIFAPEENKSPQDRNNIEGNKSELDFPEEEVLHPGNRLLLKLGTSFKVAPSSTQDGKSNSATNFQQEELNLQANDNNAGGNEQTNELITAVSSSEEKSEEFVSLKYGDSFRQFVLSLEASRTDAKQDFDQDNVAFSPFSLFTVLSMLLLGSEGETFSELSRALTNSDNTNLTPNDIDEKSFHGNFRDFLNVVEKVSSQHVTFEAANILFTDSHFKVKPSFVQQCKKYYDAKVNSFNFHSDGALFPKVVNEWVRQKTHGKISHIVDNPPSQATTLSLVNTVYFKGDWAIPFEHKFTRLRDFYVSPGESVKIPMMTNMAVLPFYETDEFRMVSIPYKDNYTSFFMILPNENKGLDGLRELESRMNGEKLLQAIFSMQPENIALKIPKFKISSDGNVAELSKRMGLSSVFDPSSSNFSRISDEPGLFVSSIEHRAVIEVNELGSTASAVTIATADRILVDAPVPFVANQPFLFFIFHNRVETILFWGRIGRPTY